MTGQDQDCATLYSLNFIRGALPAKTSRVLEIGCGQGELAAALTEAGLEIVALDMDSEAVAAARNRGVDARLAEWPGFDGGAFDAILFTRSLHHIHDLEAGVAAAFAALRDHGRIIVEDFRAEGAGERGETWFASLVRMFDRSGLLGEPTPYLRQVLGQEAPHDHGRHQLHSSSAIEHELRSSGAHVEAQDSAYYFRYLLPALGSDELGAALLQHELDLIAGGLIDPLGRRFVADAPERPLLAFALLSG